MMRKRSQMLNDLEEISDNIDIPKVDSTSVPKVLYGHSSFDSLAHLPAFNETKVLVFYTGGTIGMIKNERGKLVPSTHALDSYIRIYPHMHDAAYAEKRNLSQQNSPLILPESSDKSRVLYWVFEYNPLLDSSDMTMDDWIRIAMDIKYHYENFDGFVILHGTDTLCYTASALSFMMENLGKPIVITGSQIPLFETRSDGRDNFISSLIIAGTMSIPEVTVFFNNKLYRGNRCLKVSTGSLDAFCSPNLSPLAVAGIFIEVDYRLIFRPNKLERFRVEHNLNRNIGLLRLFPSILTETIKSVLQPPTAGIVLQTYGAGNLPINRKDIIEVLREATERGVLIINITQCIYGSVEAIYETGQILRDAGVLVGYDMTTEAALTKLAYVIGKNIDLNAKRKLMCQNLRGEMTIPPQDEPDTPSTNIVNSIARSLALTDSKEVEQVKEILIPNLFLNAVQNSDITRMETLWPHVNEVNYIYPGGGMTALHVAASEGDVDTVTWLLKNGASVHTRNNNGHTPLWLATEKCNIKVINLLRRTGAHILIPPLSIAEAIVNAAGQNDCSKLKAFHAAGCDMSLTDIFLRNGLHAASIMGHLEAVKFLLAHGVSPSVKDVHGVTPVMCAEKGNHASIVEALTHSENQKEKS